MGQSFVLVTNDDGFDAPGLAALVEAVSPLGRVVVVAPDREQSGSSHALTLVRPLRAYRVADDRHRVDGTPTDCVHLAINSLTGGKMPDLVVSGMNRGLNVGDDVTYSGTVAGAMEGTLLHIPSIAFSVGIESDGQADFTRAVPFARRISEIVLERGLQPGVLLNVNFPAASYRGVRITRQGTRTYRATALERLDPAGRPYYWIDSVSATPTDEPDGDHRAIREGYVSVSPLTSNLTHAGSLERLREWNLGLA
ncbi:MAG TPA: 5'/3'-nucleotidase SurE [Candidatus Polarisedimenticolaceae bacterium]|nr:5'/3'-nucleotidase SurE [Candidatus Polarisedimenticolaceae bacterium]